MLRHRLGSLAQLAQAAYRTVNAVISARLQQMALEQRVLYHGADFLSGFVKRFPSFRGKLAESWDAYSI